VWPIRDRTVRQTDVVELVGLLRQQEARENFEAGRLVDFRLELEQRLDLVLAEPDSLEAARAERQRQGLQPVDEHHSRHVTVAYTSRQVVNVDRNTAVVSTSSGPYPRDPPPGTERSLLRRLFER